MIDPKKLHELTKQGIVKTEKGIRVIDASRLPTAVSRKSVLDPGRGVQIPEPAAAEAEEPAEPKTLLPADLRKRETLNKQFKKEFKMNEQDVPKGVGLDIGTSFLVAGRFADDGSVRFRKIRDCFLQLTYKSPINKKMIQKGLDDRQAPYIVQPDGFYVLGEPAFLMANERHLDTRRPMQRGVLSPKEKAAFPILKELISQLLGEAQQENEQVVFSVPAKPIDAQFDQIFHQDMIRSFITSLGYTALPMNEGEALAYSELLNEGLTGIAMSCGAGMINVAIMSAGDAVVTFSTSRAGDWIDAQAATATDLTQSIIQQEKESEELDLMSPDPSNQIHQALAIYYGNLLVYTLEQIAYDLSRSPALPKFKDPIPLVVGGGTSLPKGFIPKFEQALGAVDMPVEIREVRHASDPLHAVANGLTLAASME